MNDYLCIEAGERFIIKADSLEEAQAEAATWNAEVICKIEKKA